ncbi:hypothetical protein D9X30_3251 [Cupriavidus sp. U2]|uniref:S8 family serine peptidase n=1 Tax=Cupriavidus sp. U2 TaxID=2920269 RepID=UPI001892CE1F|nr:S8 family serine peptidase [Cupriavidus sp. U2]KAI3591726.1 hypothetical protein D9X30_3251 [Cupriavidus sp. U2]
MADALIDVKLVEGFVLPYESGAEQYLGDFKTVWDQFFADYPDLHLDPAFAAEEVPLLADMVDVARTLDGEPPDPFAWFAVTCDEAVASTVADLLFGLPFVESAHPRPPSVPVGRIAYGTNEYAVFARQVREAPVGIGARFAWRVPGGSGRGVRVAIIDQGFGLAHEDLVTVPVTTSIFGAADLDHRNHGTAALGIVVAADNGAGIVGIAPDVDPYAVSDTREDGVSRFHSAFGVAQRFVQPGGVVWFPLAFPVPGAPANAPGAYPMEGQDVIQDAIQLASFFGIAVVEPAGNAGVNLDTLPVAQRLNPASSRFHDSMAIVVGGGQRQDDGTWIRDPGSTFGTRVDCFASFSHLQAPIDNPANPAVPYTEFAGTSGASSVIAGVVCAIQGMCQAATNGQCLHPITIRALLRDPALCTPADPPGRIGGMPDLRRIAARMGWARILPAPAAVAVAGDSALLVTTGDDDQLRFRIWSRLTGLDTELLHPVSDDRHTRFDVQPALLMTLETAPLLRTVFEVFMTAANGSLRYYYWDTLGNTGDIERERTPPFTFAPGYDVAACHPLYEITTIVGTQMTGKLVAVDYDATVMGDHDFSDPVALDDPSTYRRAPGPAMLSRKPRTLDVAAIDDAGALRWIAGTIPADSFTTFWRAPVAAQCGVAMDPGAKPGMAGNLGGVAVLAVGVDGLLYACGFGLQPAMMETLTTVSQAISFAAQGPVALAMLADDMLLAAAVGGDGLVYASTRALVMGGRWSAMVAVDPAQSVSPAGGVTLVAQGNAAMLFAVLPDGRPGRADFTVAGGWSTMTAG